MRGMRGHARFNAAKANVRTEVEEGLRAEDLDEKENGR